MGSNQSCTVIRQGDWEHHLCWTETPKTIPTENWSTKRVVINSPKISTESDVAKSTESEVPSSSKTTVDSRHNSQRLK
jgi:hypothetical protein